MTPPTWWPKAVASASAPSGAPATDRIGAVNALLAGQPKLSDKSLDTAMKALLDSSDAAAAWPTRVAITEQQLFARAAALSDAKSALAGWLPSGPAPVADFLAVLLSGDWIARNRPAAPASSGGSCCSPTSWRNWRRPASAPRATHRPMTW